MGQLLNFADTSIAFAHKNNAELNKAYWLFKLMNNPSLVNIGTSLANWAIKKKLPVKGLIKATVFNQFCGGETIAECLPTIEALGRFGIGSILDYSVEGKHTDKEFEDGVEETIRTIEIAANNAHIPFAVFKVTGIASFDLLAKVNNKNVLNDTEQNAWELVKSRVKRICSKAASLNQPVFIDAEESWIQDAIDVLAHEMMLIFNKEKPIVYNTIQLYRHDRLQFLQSAYSTAQKEGYKLAVKLVRGAYMEKERERAQKMAYPDPIQPNKAACDRDYDRALSFCIEHIHQMGLCAGSHNEASNLLLARLIDEKQISRNHPQIWFSQLYGMSDNLSFNLAASGYNVCKYLPYGPVHSVLPYLTRRAAENTAMAGQMSREFTLIATERNRRKTK